MDLTLRVMGDKISESHAQARGAETGEGRRRRAGEEQSHQCQASSEDQEIKNTLSPVGTTGVAQCRMGSDGTRTQKQSLGRQPSR